MTAYLDIGEFLRMRANRTLIVNNRNRLLINLELERLVNEDGKIKEGQEREEVISTKE